MRMTNLRTEWYIGNTERCLIDVDGRFACVVNDRGTVYMFRRDEGYWEQFDELDIEYAHKCDIAGDVVAIRNWEGVLLYSIDEMASWGGVVPL